MHELSVTQEVIRISCEEAAKAGLKQIKEISLVIGDMSGVVDDSVQFYFDTLTKGTPAEGACLKFTRLPMLVCCQNCNYRFHPQNDMLDWECPKCHKWSVEVIQGKEFYIDNIEAE